MREWVVRCMCVLAVWRKVTRRLALFSLYRGGVVTVASHTAWAGRAALCTDRSKLSFIKKLVLENNVQPSLL